MSRQGLMDDSGYHGFDECARYELCQEETYKQAKLDALDKLTAMRETHRGSDYQWREYVRFEDVKRVLSN